ncbi:hypothetical protein DVS77_02235 [Mycolicibacterium moriokaense]|nr:hypothetical protein DVS77_02235 [Mycolicibacterium moriokaense]
MRPTSSAAALCVSLAAITVLPSCGSSDSGEAATSTAPPSTVATTTAAVATPQAPPGPQPKNWFDLQVGDCVTEIPAIESGVVSATVVDCAAPHQAEVFLLAPLAVDTAVDQVAGEKCAEGFATYTGKAANAGPYSVTYLIDSNQDRTANNPTPSTAICFLQDAKGGPLTTSARR